MSGSDAGQAGGSSTAKAGPVSVDVRLGPEALRSALRRDARVGLTSRPKWTSPVWFYDERGSELYEQITRLPEYYPFRLERSLLLGHADDIARRSEAQVLVELGSGTSEKTRALLSAMSQAPAGLRAYIGFDVSEAHLRAASQGVADDYGIDVHAVTGNFLEHLDAVPDSDGPRLVAFLGSTIGNLDPVQRREFLQQVGGLLKPGDSFLLATDLVKPVDRLVAAYDDPTGVTAAFNRNVLTVLNRELGAGFDPGAFDHLAVWVPESSWVEMRLRARVAMTVPLPELDVVAQFAAGEAIRTEVSTKFTPPGVRSELAQANLDVAATWSDPAGDYLLTLATR